MVVDAKVRIGTAALVTFGHASFFASSTTFPMELRIIWRDKWPGATLDDESVLPPTVETLLIYSANESSLLRKVEL